MSTDGSTSSLGSPPVDGDRNRGPILVVLIVVFHVISTICVLARLFVRARIIKKLGFDDLLIFIAYILWIVTTAFTALSVRYGLGRHQYYLSLTPELLLDLVQVVKWQFLSEIMTAWSLLITRISVCLFLLRIFGTLQRWKWLLYSVTAFITITNLASLSIILAECRPVSKNWDPLLPGKCISPTVITFEAYYNGAISVACDWALASLPILCMWNVQMPQMRKTGICILMAMGFFTGICALVRTSLTKTLTEGDVTWNIFPLDVTVILEQDIGLITACIPTLRPLFRLTKQKMLSLRSKSTKETAPQTFDDQHRLHKVPAESSPPLSLSPLSSQGTVEKSHTDTAEDSSARQHNDLNLGTLANGSGDLETGIRKTVDVEWERTLHSEPGTWSPMAQIHDDRGRSSWV